MQLQTNEILKELTKNPLLITSWDNLDMFKKVVTDCDEKNIFVGIGVMTHAQVSTNIPFDILGVLLTLEHLKRIFHSQKVIVFVADQHAFTNELVSKEHVLIQTNLLLRVLRGVVNNLGLISFEFIQTSTLDDVKSIRSIFSSLPVIENQYLKHEVADAIWVNTFHQVNLKLGWAMGSEKKVEGHDERFFDKAISTFCPHMHFIHIKPGRTFDVKRPRVSPYISTEGEKRILLNSQERVIEKLRNFKDTCPGDTFKAGIRHLSAIIRLHDMLFDPLRFMTFEEKLQTIINKATV